jgi:hypothetical protein
VDLQQFRDNRARIPWSELAKYRGKWVAFSKDGRNIIASNEDFAILDTLVVAAGEDPEQVAFERIEFDDICLGGAELQ